MKPVSLMQKSRVFAAFVVFSVMLGTPFAALAATTTTSTRYFMPNTSAVWRNVMGARHVFDDGFTADLSAFQLRVAKFAGLKPIPVKNFNILADDVAPSVSPTPQVTPTQSVPWGVRAMLNDDTLKTTTGGVGVTIAILDTGIDREHPDLKSRVDGCYDYTDLTKGFVDNSCDDLNGHGTHMAGIIAADGGPHGDGIYGFAPQASISIYKTCNSTGSCMSDDIAVAMRNAVDNGAQIIVLGFGGESESSFIDDAIAYAHDKGVLVIAAAGNDGPYDDSLDWPARNPAVMSVGALDSDLAPADFSSRGINATTEPYSMDAGDIEFAAPGVNVESTFRGGGYAIMSGTSMAAASLAGMTARLWQSGAEQPASATRFLLHEISEDIAPKGDDNASGFGMPRTIIQ
jgi:subtilisin family serine protease